MTRGPETAHSYDTRKPTLYDVLSAARRGTMLDLRVFFPATVSEILDNGARVNVTADIKDVLATERGELDVEPIEIPALPVWSAGQGRIGGGYLQFPIAIGDKGWVMVNDRSIDGWYTNGLPAKPSAHHTHNMVDGVFMPGARDSTRALAGDQLSAVLEHSLIKIGEGAALGAARTSDAVAAAASMAVWIGKVTAVVAAIDPTTVPPLDFGTISGGSTKTRIE